MTFEEDDRREVRLREIELPWNPLGALMTFSDSPSNSHTRGVALKRHSTWVVGCSQTSIHFRKRGAVSPAGVANGGEDCLRSIGVDSGAIHVPAMPQYLIVTCTSDPHQKWGWTQSVWSVLVHKGRGARPGFRVRSEVTVVYRDRVHCRDD